MANQLPPIPQDQIGENHPWRDWFRNLGNYIQAAQGGGVVWTIAQGGTGSSTADGARFNLGIGTMGVQNSDNVAITGGTASGLGISGGTASGVAISGGSASGVTITGGTINNTPIGQTTPSAGAFTTNLTRNGYTAKPDCYIEAYDLSSSIALTSTPTILAPASTVAGATGITYSAGVFTFAMEGDYSLALSVNAIASAANQFVYIYAENNTGSGWTLNTNSGKIFVLPNGQATQIVYSQAVHRVAGQQVRYQIYSNDGKVTLQTTALPSTSTVYVPAIRIQYS